MTDNVDSNRSWSEDEITVVEPPSYLQYRRPERVLERRLREQEERVSEAQLTLDAPLQKTSGI